MKAMQSYVLRVVSVCVLCTLLEFLLPEGKPKKSAVISLRMIALLCIAQTFMEWG